MAQQRSATSSPPSSSAAPPPPSTSTLSSVSWFRRLTFSWIAPVMRAGHSRGYLELSDIPQLEGSDSTQYLSAWFRHVWSNEVRSKQDLNRARRWKSWRMRTTPKIEEPSLIRCLWECFGWKYMFLGLLKFISDCFMFSGPILLGYLVTFVESYEHQHDTLNPSTPETKFHGYIYASALVLGVLLNSLCSTQYTFGIRKISLYLKSILITSIYRKSLRISATSRREFSLGRINNIMSIDTDRVCDISISLHEFWSLPIQIGIALYLLYAQVNLALLGGLLIVLLLIPVNAYLTKCIQRVTKAMMAYKDERILYLDELIRNIRVIKYIANESYFMKRIQEVRQKEMAQLRTRKYLDALCVYLWASTPILVSLATFSAYSYLLHRNLTSAKVFTSLALFNILIRPLNAFPWVINGFVEGRVSAKRVYAFLKCAEIGEAVEEEMDAQVEVEQEYDATQKTWYSPTAERSDMTASSSFIAPSPRYQQPLQQQQHDPERCIACITGDYEFVLPKREAKDVTEADAANQPAATCDAIPMSAQPTSPRDPDNPSAPLIPVSASSSSLTPSSSTLQSGPPLALSSLALHIYSGEFLVLHGVVGSGKTTLLLGLLGELSPAKRIATLGAAASPPSTRALNGSVAYVSQEIWLPNATVRENILFHSPYDPVRYQNVLSACCLLPDLQQLADGDQTEVGEGGTNLSGGQMARLSLARAVYSNASIILLDDPLSSVDAHVAHHIVREVLDSKTGLLAGRTRVLVTHHVQMVRRRADRVVKMEKGRIVEEVGGERNGVEEEKAETVEEEETSVVVPASPSKPAASSTALSTASLLEQDARETAARLGLNKGYLTATEVRERGAIRSRVLWTYLGTIGWLLVCVIAFSMVTMQASRNACDWWLSYWVEEEAKKEDGNDGSPPSTGDDSDQLDSHYYLRIFAYLAASNTFFALFRSFIFAYGGLRGAHRLFNSLLISIIHAPVSFFDENPVGRILNRFSTDMYAIDESIPFISNIFLAQLFLLIGSLVIIGIVVPGILLLLPILALIYYFIQAAYRSISRELRRLDSTTRSPIYTKFSETLTGLPTIRAFKYEAQFEEECEARLDANQRVSFINIGLSNWLNLRLQCIGVTMITLVSFLSLLSCLSPNLSFMKYLLNPAMIGLGIAYALPLTDTLNGLIGSATDTEKEIISVERTVEYIKIKSEEEEDDHYVEEGDEKIDYDDDIEAPQTNEKRQRERKIGGINAQDLDSSLLSNPVISSSSSPAPRLRPQGATKSLALPPPPASWPAQGSISFSHVTFSYRADLAPALRDVSIEVPAGKRVAIVGRTGSGKSTLFQTLFRMRSIRIGSISIDGRDISTIPRRTLRRRLAIIPQAPCLFLGTIRENLVPKGDDEEESNGSGFISDDEIWNVLTQCQMDNKIRSLENGLSHTLTESSHLSVGERQLLCFARAMLKKARIVVLDEATASVDHLTATHIDRLTLSLPSTVLLIAHRVSSVLGFDTIVYMEDGRVCEVGTPAGLLANKASKFAKLVEQQMVATEAK